MTGSGFRIGKLFGINIRIDWSWLFIFALVTWNLATVFGDLHPEWGSTAWLTAVVAGLAFFSSVLAHELAHSLVARAQGTEVDSITLFLFGGVSNIQDEPESPQNEFIMALLGPVTSLVIGGLLILLASLSTGSLTGSMADPMETLGRLGPLTTLALWLGTVNVFLGFFNLVPGFPLDGGRVVRSILWAITDNLRRATRWASWLGQGIAWLMIISGIATIFGARIPLVGEGFLNGLWLAFIGWFLSNAAAQSYRRVVVEDILDGVDVSRVMREDPPTVSPGISVDSLVHDYMMRSDDQGFPVLDNGRLAGIVTLDDVRSRPREEWEATSVRQIMTPADDLVTVSPDECASDVLTKLAQNDVRQIPVARDGELLGLVRRRDIVRWLRLHSDLSR